MKTFSRSMTRSAVAALGLSAAAFGGSLDGRWEATLVQGGVTVPFRLEINGDGDKVVGTLFGHEQENTTSASLKDGNLQLSFEHYQTTIWAKLGTNGELDGNVEISRRGAQRAGGALENEGAARAGGTPFHAKRYVAPTAAEIQNVPSIDGVWEVVQDTAKGEHAWRVIVQQKGIDITATTLRVDGDTGALTGGWRDGKFVASHFDGARPGVMELTPQADGSLLVVTGAGNRAGKLVAYRPEVARAKGLPEPENYQTHTTVRDPNEVFTYSFPDTKGIVVNQDDPRFKGKVVLAIVTGTWCPNCHDEARYLVKLYEKYHSQGLEIVALDFEEPEQLNSPKRVNAFIKQYKVPYTYLLAGEPAEMWDKVPQAVNLNTWPATLFIGRDGKVKATHAGFAGPGSGVFYKQLQDEFTSNIERLLKEVPAKAIASR
jgi:thiol-disulfide isomerase/thioredoxin